MNLRQFWQKLFEMESNDELLSERMCQRRSGSNPNKDDHAKHDEDEPVHKQPADKAKDVLNNLRTSISNRRTRKKQARKLARDRWLALPPEQRRIMRRKRAKRISLYALATAGILVAALAFALDVGSWTWLSDERLLNLKQTTLMYDGNNVEVAGLHIGENRLPIDVMTLPDHVRQAFVAAEDARFYSHHGIDVKRIGGAMLKNLKSRGYAQGASTISQQLIKLTHLSSEKTIARKANEAVLSLTLEARYSKDEILGMYMNTVYFGHGAYGIEAAARAYFSKPAAELDVAESALMAAVIKSPSGYAPHIKPERALERRNWVLSEMLRLEFISQEQYDQAIVQPIELNEQSSDVPDYGWYIDYALGEAEKLLELNPDELLSGGYRIYTALDTELQQTVQTAVSNGEFPADASDGTACQTALCALDNESGAITALIGGRTYEVRRGLNRAADIRRQPGSAIKPLAVYAPAIDKFGYLPTSFLSDVPTDFDGWKPRNAGNKYRGIVTLRQTVMSSINVPTVELLNRIGIKSGIRFLNSVGISTDPRDEVLSLALGAMTYGVSPLDMCGAYAAIASGGIYREPYAIRAILDSSGNVVYAHDSGEKRVMSEQSAYILTGMLESVASKGTASKLSALGISIAAKTGTAALSESETGISGNRDIWMAAYTPALTLSVWIGFDRTDATHYMPESASGSNQPAKLVLNIMKSEAAAKYAGGSFKRPSGLREVMIDGWALNNLHTLMLAGEDTPADMLVREVFTLDKLPSRVSTLFSEMLSAYDVSVTRDAYGKPRIEFTCPQSHVQYRIYRDDGDGRTLAGTLEGEEGQKLSMSDIDAPDARSITYEVVPYSSAQDAEGLATRVTIERTFWDEISGWFGGDSDEINDSELAPSPEADTDDSATHSPSIWAW